MTKFYFVTLNFRDKDLQKILFKKSLIFHRKLTIFQLNISINKISKDGI